MGAPSVEANEGCSVEGVDVVGVVEEGEGLRLDGVEDVGTSGGFNWLAAVEVPAETETKEDDQRRGEHDRQDSRGRESGEACNGMGSVEEGLEPLPGGGSEKAK